MVITPEHNYILKADSHRTKVLLAPDVQHATYQLQAPIMLSRSMDSPCSRIVTIVYSLARVIITVINDIVLLCRLNGCSLRP